MVKPHFMTFFFSTFCFLTLELKKTALFTKHIIGTKTKKGVAHHVLPLP